MIYINPVAIKTREKNARRIVDYVINHGVSSRIELAKALNLSTSTITNIVAELIAKKLFLENESGKPSAGRKTMLLRFNMDLHNILIVSICHGAKNGNFLDMAICNLHGDIVIKKEVFAHLTICDTLSESDILKNLIATVKTFVNEQPSEVQASLYAVGVCVDGMADAHQLVDMPILNWKNVDLSVPLRAALHLPVYIGGITRIKALYEMRFVDSREKNIIYLNLSGGVGIVHFFDGKMVLGRNGIAGEAGHITLNLHGPKCYCGNRGCFEYYCGMTNILHYAEQLLIKKNEDDVFYDLVIRQQLPLTLDLVFKARELGSLVVHELLCNTAEYLGAGITSLFNIYDCDRIIISGYLDSGKDDWLIDRAITYCRSHVVNPLNRDLNISHARLKSSQQSLASSMFVLTRILDDILSADKTC